MEIPYTSQQSLPTTDFSHAVAIATAQPSPLQNPQQSLLRPTPPRQLSMIKRESRYSGSPSSENYIRTLSGPDVFKLGLTKINDMFYIGSIEEARNNEVLFKHKINCILNLTQNDVLNSDPSAPIQCYNCPLSLKSFCCMMQSLPDCLNYLENAIDNNHRIAILCRDGFTKALNLVIAFYILKYGASYQDIRSQLNDIVPQVTPYMNAEYERHLQKMATMITPGVQQNLDANNNSTKRISRPPSHSYRLYNLKTN